MARATRASALAEKQQNTPAGDATSLPNSNDIANAPGKKRKRQRSGSPMAVDEEESPAPKQPKMEDEQNGMETEVEARRMNKEDADKLLEVLEMCVPLASRLRSPMV
jgi:hypothetical protein